MDLGIQGRTAIVNAASKGLGKASAMALAREGVNLVITARSEDVLAATAEEIRGETGVEVTAVAADVATPEGRAAVLAACPNPDILVNNCGGPPPGDFRDWDRDDWIRALDANMLSTIEMIKATIDGMIERGFGRVVNITSSSIKAPIAILGLSNGARGGLTGFIAGLSRDVVKHNVVINNLLPGMYHTATIYDRYSKIAEEQGISYEEAVINHAKRMRLPTGDFGNVDDFGAFAALLCSEMANYTVGQSIVMDGGVTNSTF